MAHAVESMAYVGETPWHGLGTNLEAPPSVAEAIRVAGLNWQVNLVRLQMPDGRQVDRYATVRSTDNKVLGTVGPDYVPVQNDRAFAFFEPYVQSGPGQRARRLPGAPRWPDADPRRLPEHAVRGSRLAYGSGAPPHRRVEDPSHVGRGRCHG